MKRIVALGLSLLTSACGNEPASEPGAPPTFEGTASSGERIDFLDKSAIGHPPADPPPWITNLAVVDLDQDGLLDVVLCDATRNQVAWIRQAPLGTFTESVTVEDVRRRTHTGSVTLTVLGDIASHQFGNEIIWLAEVGITAGCAAHSYCPDKPVTRAQMASFLARALDLEAPQQQAGFVDVDPAGVHAANIEALHAAEITKGCTQQPLQYCPDRPVIRAQMASFLARALDLDSPSRRAGFADVDPESVHAVNIEALHAAEITTGCTQEPLQYCPNRPITRAQMAAFLYRARDLISTVRASAGT